jgi:hypothetical protein
MGGKGESKGIRRNGRARNLVTDKEEWKIKEMSQGIKRNGRERK